MATWQWRELWQRPRVGYAAADMLIAFLVVLGGLFGASIGDEEGFFTGALIGFSIGHFFVARSRTRKLEARVVEMERQLTIVRLEGTQPGEARASTGARVVVPNAAMRATGATQASATSGPAPASGAIQSTAAIGPTSPTGTTEPTGPTEPIQPTAATGPTQPTAATGPTSPTEPTSPTGPASPLGTSAPFPPTDRSPALPPLPPAAPAAPSFDPIGLVRDFFLGGNTVVRVGIVILLFGVGFLVKYASDNNFIPIELRLLGVVLLGLALLVVGWRVRDKRFAYGVSLQGGGIGVIYLVTFAALKIYNLVPPSAALTLFVILGIATAVLSILQDALALAVLGIIGGFLAPILASTGSGDHVGLFTYYALLNAGILGIAWFKAWRVLNLVGFTFTFIIGTMWGVTSYEPEHFESAQFFLALFFVFYAAIAVIYALRRPTEQRGFVDTSLVFGLPAITFCLEVGLVVHTEWGLALAALVLAAFYVVVATLVYKVDKERGKALAEAFTAIGLTFATMAVPFALNASWTAAAYALEGAGLVWIGRKQNRPLAEAAGVFLQFAAGVTFDTPNSAEIHQPVLDYVYPYAFLRAVGAVASAYFLRTRISQLSSIVQGALILWALGWTSGGVFYDIIDHRFEDFALLILLTAATAHSLILQTVGSRLRYWPARFGALSLAPKLAFLWCMQCVLLADAERVSYAFVGWAAGMAMWMALLKRNDNEEHPKVSALAFGITPALFSLIIGLNAWYGTHRAEPRGVWALSAAAVAPAAFLGLVLALSKRDRWPMARFRRAVLIGCEPVVAFLALWSFVLTFGNDGNPRPLPYVPVFNPLDLAQLFIVIAGTAWAIRLRIRDRERYDVLIVPAGSTLAALLFLHLSAVCIRSVHHYAGVPFDFDSLMASNLVQTSLSITWSVIALIVTAIASRKGWRHVWIVGGVLLGVVVVKLFLVDLSNIATVARIVSFLVVGMLLLLIGWVSPVPPKAVPKTA